MANFINSIHQLYYRDYFSCFHLGSYSAFIRGFCSYPIANYLSQSPVYQKQSIKRLTEARQIVRDAIQLGLDNPKVNIWFEKMNSRHQKLAIPNEHFLYAIANFIIEPIRVLRQRAKLRLAKSKQIEFLAFWQKFAAMMKLTNIPNTLRQWLTLRNNYEYKYQQYSTVQKQLLDISLFAMIKIIVPKGFRSLLSQLIIWQLPQKFCLNLNLQKSLIVKPFIEMFKYFH